MLRREYSSTATKPPAGQKQFENQAQDGVESWSGVNRRREATRRVKSVYHLNLQDPQLIRSKSHILTADRIDLGDANENTLDEHRWQPWHYKKIQRRVLASEIVPARQDTRDQLSHGTQEQPSSRIHSKEEKQKYFWQDVDHLVDQQVVSMNLGKGVHLN